MRQFRIDFSRNLARENKSKFTELNSRLAALEWRVHRGENLSALLEEARAELGPGCYVTGAGPGGSRRGKINSIFPQAGKSSRPTETDQNAIRQSDGTVVLSKNDVLGVWHDFYFHLFSTQELSEVDLQLFLDSIERRRVRT